MVVDIVATILKPNLIDCARVSRAHEMLEGAGIRFAIRWYAGGFRWLHEVRVEITAFSSFTGQRRGFLR